MSEVMPFSVITGLAAGALLGGALFRRAVVVCAAD